MTTFTRFMRVCQLRPIFFSGGLTDRAKDSPVLQGSMRDLRGFFRVSDDMDEFPAIGVVMTTYNLPAICKTSFCLPAL